MLILTFNDSEETAIRKVIAALANEIEFEVLQSVSPPMLSFSAVLPVLWRFSYIFVV